MTSKRTHRIARMAILLSLAVCILPRLPRCWGQESGRQSGGVLLARINYLSAQAVIRAQEHIVAAARRRSREKQDDNEDSAERPQIVLEKARVILEEARYAR